MNQLATFFLVFSLPSGWVSARQSPCQPRWLPTFGASSWVEDSVHSLAVFDDGGGPALYAGGFFRNAGGTEVNKIARWASSGWSELGLGLGSALTGDVFALAVFDDGTGTGPALYAGGTIVSAGGNTAVRIAKWDGANWSALGSGMAGGPFFQSRVRALTVYDDGRGNGPALYAGGYFTLAGGVQADKIARWDGFGWSSVGTGMGGSHVNALTVFDDGSGGGPALYAAGFFSTAGGLPANSIAKWDGTSWSPLGNGLTDNVFALAVYDDGSGGGPALYAAGAFTSSGGVAVSRIAKWDGATWSALGSGLGGSASTLAVFDDSSGGALSLYCGGDFTSAGGVAANRIARWDGLGWSAVGSGMDASVHALTVFDDGTGPPRLLAAGDFTSAGGALVGGTASWDGSSWRPLGKGPAPVSWACRFSTTAQALGRTSTSEGSSRA